jgi:mRNA interferase HigB
MNRHTCSALRGGSVSLRKCIPFLFSLLSIRCTQVRIIKTSTLREFWRKHPAAEQPLKRWLGTARMAAWRSIDDVRRTYPHADAAVVASGNTVTIFNIGGNDFRLVVAIKYRFGTVYIRDFMTHAEYSKGAWKERH